MKNKATHQVVSGFFFRVVAAVMGCFFGCLRVKDSTSTRSSSSTPSAPPSSEVVVVRKRNRLSSLMISESVEEEECRKLEDKGNENWESLPNPHADVDMKELEDEAKFLKAWGTLPETPAEVRMSREVKCRSSENDNPEDSNSRSWLVGMPTEQLNFEKESSQPLTPEQKCEQSAKATISSSAKNSETISVGSSKGNNEEQSGGMTSKVYADQGYESASVVQGRKSVRFYSDTSVQNLSPDIDNQTPKDLGAASICNISRPDPYPTPRRLNDDMQTPGTVFSAYPDGMANGKKTRIRSQFVKSNLNSVENLYQGMEVDFSELGELSVEQESVEAGAGQSFSGKELNIESKKAPCLRSNVTNQDEEHHSMSQESVIRTLEDRPIIGLVAAHWNKEEEASRISPKSWDGNGIPNSTSKYKEDQKVSWHSTPFVERLEKALSDDTLIPQRKPDSGRSPTAMSGLEESDTAISKLQSSVNIKSIASC